MSACSMVAPVWMQVPFAWMEEADTTFLKQRVSGFSGIGTLPLVTA